MVGAWIKVNRWCSVNLYLVSPKVLKLLLISSRTSSMEINDLPGARNLAQSMVVGEIKTIMGVGRGGHGRAGIALKLKTFDNLQFCLQNQSQHFRTKIDPSGGQYFTIREPALHHPMSSTSPSGPVLHLP